MEQNWAVVIISTPGGSQLEGVHSNPTNRPPPVAKGEKYWNETKGQDFPVLITIKRKFVSVFFRRAFLRSAALPGFVVIVEGENCSDWH